MATERGGDKWEGFPTRGTFACLALGCLVFAWYVSLLPFRLEWVPLRDAVSDFVDMMSSWPATVPRVNFLANALMFVPVGFGFYGAFQTDRKDRFAGGAVIGSLVASVAGSLTAEFLQEFAPGRVVASPDVVAQTLGAMTGVVLWLIAGPDLVHWIRDTRRDTHHDRATRALVAYLAFWAFVNLAPFDITLNVDRLGQRWREGEIVLIPFTSNLPWTRLAWDAVVTAVSAIPIGTLLLVGWQPRGERRGLLSAVWLGVVILAALETAQIFIRSHGADMTDVVCGMLGVLAGAAIGAQIFDRSPNTRSRATSGLWGWTGMAVWCVMLAAYHWQPFDFVVDGDMIRERLARVSLIPLAGYRSGSDLNAFNTLLAKLGMAVPFGVAASLALHGLRKRPAIFTLMWMMLAAIVFSVMEFGQFFLPTRVPDPSDVGLGIAGSAGGVWLARWLQAGYEVRHPQRVSHLSSPSVVRDRAQTGMLLSRKKMEGQEE
ncbi:MAG: VanZ family protein [Acidobacteria bacterium]|nr:VanZ family protein [Acidobacteriota bacterium]